MSAPTRRASSRQIRRSASRTSRVELTVAEIAASASLAETLRELGVQARVVLGQPPPLEHAADDRAEPRQIDGLHDVARAPALHRLDRGVEGRVPRDHDDLRAALDAPGRAHDGGAVDVGEIGVEQDEGEAGLAEQAQAVAPGRGDDDRISLTLEEVAQEERGFGVSIDDQGRVLLPMF